MTRRLRQMLTHPLVEPQIATLLRSRLVDRPARFALREWLGRRGPYVYRVRENGLRVLIAHRASDVHALDQAFYQHAHEPPPAVLQALRSLGRPIRALDVGANVGIWGLWLHGRLPVAHVTALEPDPDNLGRHRRQIELNRLERSWEVRPNAATLADGPVQFVVGAQANGHIADRAGAGTAEVRGVDIFALLDGIDLLKLDIEGGEWPILADPRFAGIRVPVATVEFHPDGAPGDPRVHAESALQNAGYTTIVSAEGPPGFGTCWGYRT